VSDGDPSPEVVSLIDNSFRYVRRTQWLRISLFAGISIIFMTGVISLLVIFAARREAVAIKRLADSEVEAATNKVNEAEQRLRGITSESDRLKASADVALNRASRATVAADQAVARQKVAELLMRQAQKLEQESNERASDMARREVGSRAVLLSREWGMERKALDQALEAAEQSLARGRDLPDEVIDGIAASANAADYSLPLEVVEATGEMGQAIISPNGEKILQNYFDPRTDLTKLVFWDTQTGKKISDTSTEGVVGRCLSPAMPSGSPP
jgi:hypothetical protein